MPAGGGAVYQPTTVSYEPRCASERGGILGGNSSLGVESPLRVFRKSRPQVALLVFALLSLVTGVAMLASALTDYLEAKAAYLEEQQQELSHIDGSNTVGIVGPEKKEVDIEDASNIPMSVLLGGIFMTCVGFIALGMYLKVADWRRNCVCPCTIFEKNKQSLVRQLNCQNSAGVCSNNANAACGQGIMALNPSTDPLVSHTQYSAVSELPSLPAEDEERRNLMPDNKDKDCISSAEESDRMLEPDPRIVLRPMHVEDA